MRRATVLTILFVIASFVVAVPQAQASTDGSCSSSVSADFNGDGYADLAVGAPLGDAGSVANAGIVNVLYGGLNGIDTTHNTPLPQIWYQGSDTGLAGTPEAGDGFGACLAAGDFNHDGLADLAIGVPGDNVGTVSHAGAVNVIYGTSNGLDAAHNQLFTQDSTGMLDKAKAGSGFGAALAAGDFNGDGPTDLAIGAPNESLHGVAQAGALDVLYGSSNRLTTTGNQMWTQGQSPSGTLQGHPEAGDHFAASLAAGDFTGMGRDALAVGVPGEGIFGNDTNEGVVQILYSNTTQGLKAYNNQLWFEGNNNVKGTPNQGDRFGCALAAGDFNHDGLEDLAIGVSHKNVGSNISAGAVNILYGNPAKHRLGNIGNILLTQNSPGMHGPAKGNAHFGAALTSGRFNADAFDDLAVGAPLYDDAATANGVVGVIYGSATGLNTTTVPNQKWVEGSTSAGDVPQNNDNFGAALTTGDYNDDGMSDLVIGVPNKDHTQPGQGAVIVLSGGSSGILKTGSVHLDEGTSNVPGGAHAGDQWGSALG